jgi:hypothetical protein
MLGRESKYRLGAIIGKTPAGTSNGHSVPGHMSRAVVEVMEVGMAKKN